MRKLIQDCLIFIDIDDKDAKDLMEKVYKKDGTWKGRDILVLPEFDLYGKRIGDGNGNKQIKTFAYEIRTNPKHVLMLNNILSSISMEEEIDFKFIPYWLNSMGNKNTMRNIIFQKNEFINTMVIVSILGVKPDEVDNVFAIFSEAEFMSGMEKTR